MPIGHTITRHQAAVAPPSRPLARVPPNGMRTSEATIALTNAAPDRMRRATATPRSGSAVQTLAPKLSATLASAPDQ